MLYANTKPAKNDPDETSQIISPKYALYTRKSSEAEERQALSIDSQIKEMLELAQRNGLGVTQIYQESHSAKDAGQRPIFNPLLADVRLGKFNSILVWHPTDFQETLATKEQS